MVRAMLSIAPLEAPGKRVMVAAALTVGVRPRTMVRVTGGPAAVTSLWTGAPKAAKVSMGSATAARAAAMSPLEAPRAWTVYCRVQMRAMGAAYLGLWGPARRLSSALGSTRRR